MKKMLPNAVHSCETHSHDRYNRCLARNRAIVWTEAASCQNTSRHYFRYDLTPDIKEPIHHKWDSTMCDHSNCGCVSCCVTKTTKWALVNVLNDYDYVHSITLFHRLVWIRRIVCPLGNSFGRVIRSDIIVKRLNRQKHWVIWSLGELVRPSRVDSPTMT